MRSSLALASGFALLQSSFARVANAPSEPALRRSNTEAESPVTAWLARIFRRATSATCVQDEYYDFVYNRTVGEQFCQMFLNYPNVTMTETTTPLSTFIDVTSTHYATVFSTTIVPGSTVTSTVTNGGNAKRDAAPAPTPAPARLAEVQLNAGLLHMFGRQVNTSDPTVSASFSSACSCQNYQGRMVTATETASPSVITLGAFENTVTIIPVTKTNVATTTTTTVPPSAVTGTSSSSAVGPGPTAPGFQCPEDNGSIVSQMVGPERFDYLVSCDTDITDSDFYGALFYKSLSECAAACSLADQRFDQPVCQGFSFYNAPNSAGFNCFLKESANSTVGAIGVDSGILQAIAVGMSDDTPAGTNTVLGPFPSETYAPTAASSSMSVILANRSTTISVVTPGPQVPISGLMVNAGGETLYSTYVSGGSTYSSGTGYSTYQSFTNGSWYSYYYTTYTLAWASATTVYGSSETGSSLVNSSSTDTSVGSGADSGSYTVTTTTNTTTPTQDGYNVTQVIEKDTYANGTVLSQATTTYYYSYSTGSSASGSGSNGGQGQGDVAGVSAGLITSGSVWSSVYSTVVYGSGAGGASGGGAGGAAGGSGSGAPSTPFPTTVTNTYSTAYSSPFIISGSGQGGGGGGGVGSGGAGLTAIPSPSIIVNTYSTAYGSGYAISGQASGASGANSTAASGAPVTTTDSSTSGATGISSGSLGFGSGSGSSFHAFSNTGDNRSGILSSTVVSSAVGNTVSPAASSPSATVVIASASGGSGGFFNTGDFRSGTLSSSTRTSPDVFTQVVPYGTPPLHTGPQGTALLSTGTSPFSAPGGPRSGSFVSTPIAPPGTASSGTAPTGIAPTGTKPFSAPTGSRSGTVSPSTTRSAPFPTGTGPSSCVTNMMGTTTVFQTTTVFGCYSNCPPAAGGFGGYGSPLTFGPPQPVSSRV